MKGNKILEIPITPQSKKTILEQIKKYIDHPQGFFHIVSLNPENIVVAFENKEFKKVIESAQIKIIDGMGVVVAGKILGVKMGERLTGVELMEELVRLANERRLRVLLIGGRPDLALSLSKCYQKKFPEAKFLGVYGVKDIKNPKKQEEEEFFAIVSDFKPHLVFAAFGSPEQELWLAHHKDKFKNCLCMGVGGAFDYLSGLVPRAPGFLRRLGLEWLFRLIIQPWRWRRQLRLLKFIKLIFLSFSDKLFSMKLLSLKTILEVLSGVSINLTSAWFGLLIVYPGIFSTASFEEYKRLLTTNLPLGILGLITSVILTEFKNKL